MKKNLISICSISLLLLLGGCKPEYVRDYCVLYKYVKLTDEEKANTPISVKQKIVPNNVIYSQKCEWD